MQTLIQDLRYGARMLMKRPGFTLIAMLSLALGLGANTAIFSLANGVFLRPLPVNEPAQIVAFNSVSADESRNFPTFSLPNYRDLRDRNDVLEGLIAYRLAPVSLSHRGENARLWSYLATGNYFDVLGVKPARGRFFTAQDDLRPGGHPLAVLTHDCWQQRFGADESVIGKAVLINGQSFTIIGVAAPGFTGTEVGYKIEMWFPSMMLSTIEPGRDYLNNRNMFNFFVQGRLKRGVTLAQAEAAFKNIAAQLAQEYPNENAGLSIELSPPGLFGKFMRAPVLRFTAVLMAVVALVLLLACTNLANLLLARATERRKEIAVRLALGAGRWRLIRQLLTESLLLSVAGGGLGLLLAAWLIEAVQAVRPPLDMPLALTLPLDYRVFLFTSALALLTGVLFGLLPAWQATQTDLVPVLKGETTTQRFSRARWRNALVVAQISLSLVLLICAGLVLRGLQNAQQLNPGFIAQNAVELTFDLDLQGYDAGRIRSFKQQLLQRVRALPEIEAAGLTDFIPLSLNLNNEAIQVEGQPETRGGEAPMILAGDAAQGALAALGTRLVAGRDFTPDDEADERHTALINDTMARRFWPNQNVLGKRFRKSGAAAQWYEVIGIMQDGKYFSLSEAPRPFAFFNLKAAEGFATLVARTKGSPANVPANVIAALRREVQQLDVNLPVYNVKTLEEHMAVPLFPARIAAGLLGSFGLLALLLAAIGIFGVMSYAVAQRTRELGIRIALGANTASLLRLVLGQGLRLTLWGLLIGLGVAWAATRWLADLLYGISARDAFTFVVVALLLAAVALLACWIPARRATKVDPMIALRCD